MNILKKEPALLIGALGSVLTIAGQVLTGDLTWAAALPLIVGVITRQLVTPTAP